MEFNINEANLTKEEREELFNLIDKANKKTDKMWKPKMGERYYFTTGIVLDGGVSSDRWQNGFMDAFRYSWGNCFKTSEEARFDIDRQAVITSLGRFAEGHNEEFGPMRYYINGGYREDGEFVLGVQGNICSLGDIPTFSSIEVAKSAIKEIGEDRLKKYYFGVKD